MMTAAEFDAFIEGMGISPGQAPHLRQWERLQLFVRGRLAEDVRLNPIAPLDVDVLKDVRTAPLAGPGFILYK